MRLALLLWATTASIAPPARGCPLTGEVRCAPAAAADAAEAARGGGAPPGRYDVRLPAASRLAAHYDLAAYRWEGVEDERGCRAPRTHGNSTTMHRFHRFRPNGVKECEKFQVSFCMLYWTRGCYRFELIMAGSIPKNYTIWVENEYTDEDFSISKPIANSSNSPDYLTVIWSFDEKTVKNTNLSYTVKLDKDFAPEMDITKNCTRDNTTIVCNVANLPEGQYNFYLKLLDVWKCNGLLEKIYGPCMWSFGSIKRSIPENLKVVAFESYEWYGGILTALAIFLLCATSLLSWVVYRKKVASKRWPQINVNDYLYSNGGCQKESGELKGIFLLYARDCEPFMDVMAKFRKYLSDSTGRKVYDIFDESHFNEIGISPYEWVQSLIEDPHIKVVVAATECADVLYRNLMQHFRFPSSSKENNLQFYTIPNCLDNIVVHSLKLIAFDTTPPYQKYFVARFPKFDKKADYLSHVSPHKRFDIPDCLQLLIGSLTEKPSNKDDRSGELDSMTVDISTVDTGDLLKQISLLYDFYKSNPSYLSKILFKMEIIDVC